MFSFSEIDFVKSKAKNFNKKQWRYYNEKELFAKHLGISNFVFFRG